MKNRSMKRYEVSLGATLPATAKMIVEATSEAEAREYAELNGLEAEWDGADYNTPQGCDIEVISIKEPQ